MSVELARRVVHLLGDHKLTIGFAESMTGGLLASTLISVPGASNVVRGSLVTYAADTKVSVLGVDSQLIATRTVFDPEVASQMARGAQLVLGSDLAIATTGVAGPFPQDGHPVGEVFIGFHERAGLSFFEPGETLSLSLGVLAVEDPEETRARIRHAVVRASLALLASRLEPHHEDPDDPMGSVPHIL